MKAKKMSGLTILLLSVLGFVMWAFFQRAFIENSSNAKNADRLLVFPILVPILAGICVYACYVISQKRTPHPLIVESLKLRSNLVFIVLSAVGLAFAYFFYTLLVSDDPKNIAVIPILNTVGFVVVAFFVAYEKDEFRFRWQASVPQILGAFIAIIGVLIMKYGDGFLKR